MVINNLRAEFSMKKGVLFDCDGVLINSEEMSLDYELAYYAEHGLHFDKLEFVEKATGLLHEDFLKLIDEEYRKVHDRSLPVDFYDGLTKVYMHVEVTKLAVIDGVREMLADLKASGIPIAVASNSRSEPLFRRLKNLGLYDYFDGHVYSADMVARGKPAPDLYEFAAAKLGLSARDCLVAEDSAPGTRAGVAAGAFVIGYSGGSHRGPNYINKLLEAGASEIVPHMSVMKGRLRRHLGLDGVPYAPHAGGPRP